MDNNNDESLVDQLEINVDVQELIRKKPSFTNKDTQSIGTISMLDGIMFKSGFQENQSTKGDNKYINEDNEKSQTSEKVELKSQKSGGSI